MAVPPRDLFSSIGMGTEMELPYGWYTVYESADGIWITMNGDQNIKINRCSVFRRFSVDDPDAKKMGLSLSIKPEQASKAIFKEMGSNMPNLRIIETSKV
jgi:hypothetical protein